jgi:hypothetical protein
MSHSDATAVLRFSAWRRTQPPPTPALLRQPSATPARVDTAALAAPRAQRTWYIWRKYVSSSSRVAVLADTPSSPSGTGSPQNCSGDRSANCLGAGADEAPLAGARRAAAAAKPRIGARSSIEDVQRGAPLKAASMAETAHKSAAHVRREPTRLGIPSKFRLAFCARSFCTPQLKSRGPLANSSDV